MDSDQGLCELHRLDDASALGDVARSLETHGIEADVWPEGHRGLLPRVARTWRLMVRCRDVVYARWVAAAAGLDTWTERSDEDSEAGFA
ncbi:MAG: hypothetical protein GX624_05345 [Actinobacteria bacterium]|nr:hypothetical protein [Actinomycetota bacterium]